MADSPERESKRRRLLESSGVSDSPPHFQPDETFLEDIKFLENIEFPEHTEFSGSIECIEGPSTYPINPGDLSWFDPGNEGKDALSSNAVASFEPCTTLHEIMDCQEDSSTQVDGASNIISYDMIDSDYDIVCFGTVSIY